MCVSQPLFFCPGLLLPQRDAVRYPVNAVFTPVSTFIPPDRFHPGSRFHPEFIPQPALTETFIPGLRRCATGVQGIMLQLTNEAVKLNPNFYG